MSPLDSVDAATIVNDTGARSGGGRRLSDKILAAFNHAYAVGETEVAGKLRAALVAAAAPHPGRVRRGGEQRAAADPLIQAERWIVFVDTRNRYRQLSEALPVDAEAVAEALAAMKSAYKAWSTG